MDKEVAVETEVVETTDVVVENQEEEQVADATEEVVEDTYEYVEETNEESSEEEKEAGIQTRIQELIDHVDGTVYYRYAKFDPTLEDNGIKGNLSSVSDWHSTRISKEYERQIQEILNTYSTKIKELEYLEENLKRNFKFRSIDIIPGQTSVTLSQLEDTEGAVKVNKSFYKLGPITVSLKEEIISTNIYYKSHEFTFEYQDSYNRAKFLLSDDVYVTVSCTSVGDLRIETSSENVTIQSMYYKEFY